MSPNHLANVVREQILLLGFRPYPLNPNQEGPAVLRNLPLAGVLHPHPQPTGENRRVKADRVNLGLNVPSVVEAEEELRTLPLFCDLRLRPREVPVQLLKLEDAV